MSAVDDEDDPNANYSHPYDVRDYLCHRERDADSPDYDRLTDAVAEAAAEEELTASCSEITDSSEPALPAAGPATQCRRGRRRRPVRRKSPATRRRRGGPRSPRRRRATARRPTAGRPRSRRSRSPVRRRERRRRRRQARLPSGRCERTDRSPRNGGSRRRRRRSSDPDKPRRPASAFILFMQDFRRQHSTAYRGVSLPDISRIGAEVWRSLPLKKKCEYQQLANARYDSYKERLDEYRAAHKRPDTAYQIFMREYYRTHKAAVAARSASPSDVLTRGARKWRRMSLHEKRPYMQCAEDLRAENCVSTPSAEQEVVLEPLPCDDEVSPIERVELEPELMPVARTRSGSLLNYIADRFCGDKDDL